MSELQTTSGRRLSGERGREPSGGWLGQSKTGGTATGRNDGKAGGMGQLGPVKQTLTYSGEPRAIARLDIDALVRQAQRAVG